MRRRMLVAGLVLAALYTLTTYAQLWRRTVEVVPVVWRTPLPGGCSIVHYIPASQQPFRTMA